MASLIIDQHVLDGLMADLVGHDRRPSAFIVYLALVRLCQAFGSTTQSLQDLAAATGLSKSAVQRGIQHLLRRELISVTRPRSTEIPRYRVLQPWVRSFEQGR
jgi:hypothetical protein